MAEQQLAVIMHGVLAGMLTRLPDNRLRFDYDSAYRSTPGVTPVSLSMPLAIGSQTDGPHERRVSNFLWGLLPDNSEVIDLWARRFQVSASSSFAILGTPVGEDCAGAISFCAPYDIDRILARPGQVQWLSDAEVAIRLRDLRQDNKTWLGKDFTGQFSLAGAQAKIALLNVDGRWGLPSGTVPTTHILKPGVAEFVDHDLNEHLCLNAASRAGIGAAHSNVAMFVDQEALVVARYDRLPVPGGVERVHQEDVCQAFGLSPALKYQNKGGPTPGQIAELLWNAIPASTAGYAVRRFADALIWNWIIGGTDAHAKNYSLLLAGSQVELAPMYDVASILPYGYDEQRLKLAMKVGGDYDLYLRYNRWPAAARELRLPEAEVLGRVRHLAAIAPQAFSDAAAELAARRLGRPLVVSLVDLIAKRAARCVEVASY